MELDTKAMAKKSQRQLERWADSKRGRRALVAGFAALEGTIGHDDAMKFCLWVSGDNYTLARRGWQEHKANQLHATISGKAARRE